MSLKNLEREGETKDNGSESKITEVRIEIHYQSN